MYNLNLLTRPVLITAAEVIAQIPADGTLQSNVVVYGIEIAEDRFICDALGWDLYEQICAQKNRVVTDDNKSELQQLFTAAYQTQAPTLKNGDVVNASEFLTPDNLQLWNDRLWKVTAEAVRHTCLSSNWAQLTNAGIMKNNPAVPFPDSSSNTQRSESVSLPEIKFVMNSQLQDRVNPALDSLRKYMCRYAGRYPLFSTVGRCADVPGCHQGLNEPAPNKNNGWITSVYDDED